MTPDSTGSTVVPGDDRVPAGEAASTPPGSRTDIPVAWDERTMLNTLLDYARATVHAKCAGISAEDARRAPLPGSPLTTISGLVSHLRWVEYGWFEVNLLGAEYNGPCTKEDPDRDRRLTASVAGYRLAAVTGYRAAVAASAVREFCR
jgi:Protein of unknown function (DUF664)